MKKFLTGLFAILVLTTVFAAAEVKASDNIGLTVGVDYWSTYLWRGQYLFGDQQGWFFPYASFEPLEGLLIGVSGEINSTWPGSKSEEPEYNGFQKNNNAFDAGIDYSYAAEGLLTARVGLWYYRTKERFFSFASGYIGLDFDMVSFITPFVRVTADYYTGTGKWEDKYGIMGGFPGDKYNYKDMSDGSSNRTDLYLQAGLKKEIEITKDVAGIDFGAVVGYARYRAWGEKINDISDIDLYVNATVNYGAATFAGGFHYVIVPGKQFKYGSPITETTFMTGAYDGEKDIHRFYATFGASYSI